MLQAQLQARVSAVDPGPSPPFLHGRWTKIRFSIVIQVASIAFMAIWMYYAAYTASLGEITTKTVESDTGGYDLSYKVRSW